jgi:hypothetical protein
MDSTSKSCASTENSGDSFCRSAYDELLAYHWQTGQNTSIPLSMKATKGLLNARSRGDLSRSNWRRPNQHWPIDLGKEKTLSRCKLSEMIVHPESARAFPTPLLSSCRTSGVASRHRQISHSSPPLRFSATVTFCSLRPESSQEHLPASIAGVLRLRAIKLSVYERSAKRFPPTARRGRQDDGFVARLKNRLDMQKTRKQHVCCRSTEGVEDEMKTVL